MTTPAGSVNDLDYIPVSATQTGAVTTVPNTGIQWGSTRGAFVAGNSIFYGSTDGNFYQASFNGTKVGTPVAIDPYNDPAWENVSTGSGQTYQSIEPSYYGELPSVTGAFYTNGRLYYTLLGQSTLYWRYFTPESGIIGATENTVPNASLPQRRGNVPVRDDSVLRQPQ